MDDLDRVIKEVRRESAGGTGGFMANVIERLGGTAHVGAAFGEPIERDGLTIIPVARVSWLATGGGGSGSKQMEDESGEGGGGIGRTSSRPVGFIRISGGEAEFVRIPDPSAPVPMILASGFVAWMVLRALRKVFR